MTDIDTLSLHDEVKSAADLQARLDRVIAGLGSARQVDRLYAAEVMGRYGSHNEVKFLAIALSDRSEFVAAHAAQGLANINSDEALHVLCGHFGEDLIERPHYLSHAIAQFGDRGVQALVRYAQSVPGHPAQSRLVLAKPQTSPSLKFDGGYIR